MTITGEHPPPPPPGCVHARSRQRTLVRPGFGPLPADKGAAGINVQGVFRSVRATKDLTDITVSIRVLRVDMPMHYSSAPVHRADCVTNAWRETSTSFDGIHTSRSPNL